MKALSGLTVGALLVVSSLAFANPWRGSGQNSDIGNDGGQTALKYGFRGVGERGGGDWNPWRGNGQNSDIGNDGGKAAFANPYAYRGGEREDENGWQGNGQNSDIAGPNLDDGISYAQDRAGYVFAGPTRKAAVENCVMNSRSQNCKAVRRAR